MNTQPDALLPATVHIVDAYIYPIDRLTTALEPAAVLAVWAGERVIKLLIEWIKAKNGRKIRVKLGDVVVEATSPPEVDKVFDLLKKHEVLPNPSEDDEQS